MAGGADAAQRVLALAEEEHALVHAGRVEDLADLHERRTAAMAKLPGGLSDEARDALRHALALQRQIDQALRQAMAATGRELAGVRARRTAARGYAPAGLERRRLDRTA